MDYKKLISELIEAPVKPPITQKLIADYCKCSPGAISRLASGDITDPKSSIGLRVVDLHRLKVLGKRSILPK